MSFEDVMLSTPDDVRINGWFIPAKNARGTLLFFHGNAGNISNRLDSIEIFHYLGLSVFIIDYRGYGKSEGSRSIPGVTLDALTAWRWLTDEKGVPAGEIVVFGRSIGGAVAMELMRRVEPRALILESTFCSLPDMVRVSYLAPLARFVIGDVWNSAEAASRLTVPVLSIHSPDDAIVPYRLGKRLYDAAPSPKTFVEIHGGHNGGFLESIDIYRPALDKFLTEIYGALPLASND
ncbi:MAG: alpha/beta hydrolase [Synergistaceae bacterium]|nr:alpha/beta hydrolase [Synergistaceae bacterium]